MDVGLRLYLFLNFIVEFYIVAVMQSQWRHQTLSWTEWERKKLWLKMKRAGVEGSKKTEHDLKCLLQLVLSFVTQITIEYKNKLRDWPALLIKLNFFNRYRCNVIALSYGCFSLLLGFTIRFRSIQSREERMGIEGKWKNWWVRAALSC